MGSNKPLIVLRLLEKYSLGTVILSDVDAVWLRDPSDFLVRHATADILISTDCLSHWIETQHEPGKSRGPYFHRCGHLPGASFGRAFNTGVVIFRNRSAARITQHVVRCKVGPRSAPDECNTVRSTPMSLHSPANSCSPSHPQERIAEAGKHTRSGASY
jgi:hypothetical protein